MFKKIILFLLVVGFPQYCQILFFNPHLNFEDRTYPNFYFFFRIDAIVLTALQFIVTLRLIVVYVKLRKSISE